MTRNNYPHVVPPTYVDDCAHEHLKKEHVTRRNAEVSSNNDAVHQPNHYTVGGIETIDFMMAKSSPEEFMGHLRLTALKYLSRAGHKDDILQEYKKAAVYLNWLINFKETGGIK
ncbi:SaV-like [uncultured Caudovirales phage]|uniref:SaV-like n=1 Tax=uncultured Caudovirales phage TaxID=2100421 RepID=A0A6J5KJU0_9CAUD|nr:SaV-like [uncultured Caudovirales phage]